MSTETPLTYADHEISRMPEPDERVMVTRLGETSDAMMVDPKFLEGRAIGKAGIALGHVPGHGGDLHFVRHEDGTAAVYRASELSPFANVTSPARTPQEIEAEINRQLADLLEAQKGLSADDITYSISRVNDIVLDFTMAARRQRFNQRTDAEVAKCCKGKCKNGPT
jgi:hypothetical protein